jgi:hypothetical protein
MSGKSEYVFSMVYVSHLCPSKDMLLFVIPHNLKQEPDSLDI